MDETNSDTIELMLADIQREFGLDMTSERRMFMYHAIIKRTAVNGDETYILFSWPYIIDIWKALKALFVQKEYEHEFYLTRGQFESRMYIMQFDNKCNADETTIEDLKQLKFSLSRSNYEVITASEDFEACLTKAIEIASHNENVQINNRKTLENLTISEKDWDSWKEKNHNYIICMGK